MRDITLAETIYPKFTTRAFASGIPTVLAGSPVISAYENDSATQITAGITLGVDHDSVIGLNMITVVATGANGFEAGKEYQLVITTGTVGGVSVVGEIVYEFTVDSSAALKAVDLLNDVAATDIVSAGAITTSSGAVSSVTLTATTTALTNVINSSSVVASVSGSVDSVTGDTKQTADHTAALADIPTVAEFNARTLVAASYFDPAADAVANVTLCATTTAVTNGVTVTTNNDKTGYSLSQSFPSNFSSMVISGAGSVDSLLQGYLNTLITETSAGRVAGNFDVFYDNANAQTTNTVDDVGGGGGGTDWSASERNEIRGRLGVTGTTATGGNTPTLSTQSSIDALNDVAATDIVSSGAITTSGGAVSSVTTVATTTALTNVINASSVVASVSGNVDGSVDSVTGDTKQTADHTAGIADIPTVSEFNARTLLAASYFDPAADTVANVTTVGTTTTNTDMVAEPTTLLTTQMSESYAGDGVAPTVAQALFIIQQTIGDFAIAGTTITTKRLDGSTTAATYTLDDGTSPTSRTRST